MNLYALLALAGLSALVGLLVYYLGRREGKRIANKMNRKGATDYVNKTLERVYDGRVGSDDFRVRNDEPWRADKGTDS